MESAAKRQKTGAHNTGYDWKLTPIPKFDGAKGKSGKGAGKGPSIVKNDPQPASKSATNNAPALTAKGVGKGAPQAKSALAGRVDKAKENAAAVVTPAGKASAKFSSDSKAGAPVGKSFSQATPKSAGAFSAPKSAPTPATQKPAVGDKGVGKGKPSLPGKAAGVVPTIAKAKAKAPETLGKGVQLGMSTIGSSMGVKGSMGKGGKTMGGKQAPIPNRACRCGNSLAEEYWQALESRETYCSNCWEKIQARNASTPTFGLVLGLEAMRDLGVQLPIAV